MHHLLDWLQYNIEDAQIDEDAVTCLNCNMTLMKDVLQTKVVAQLLMKN